MPPYKNTVDERQGGQCNDNDVEKGNHEEEVSKGSSTTTSTSSPPSSTDSSEDLMSNEEELVNNNHNKTPVCPFNQEYSRKEYVYVVCAGLALAFNSGYINGACLSGLLISQQRQSVSGFTGAYTASGLGLADGNVDLFGFQTCMILSFMAGSLVAGLLTPTAQAWRIAPTYGPTFLVGGAFLLVSTLVAILAPNQERVVFYFAAAANGVSNGVSSMYSGNLIRTCHLTGTTTDIGLLVGQLLRGNTKQVWKLRILIGLALSFWCGGVISFYATRKFTNQSLLFNAVLFFLIGVSLVAFLVMELDISIKQATFGTWSWQEALEKLNLRTSSGEPVSVQQMMEVFDNIDADRNDVIEEQELHDALKSVGIRGLSKRRVKAMMSIADENGDGLISRLEWKELVMGSSNSTAS